MSSKHFHNVASGLTRGVLGLAGVLTLALPAQAQVVSVVDDFEAGTAQNKFLGYTFYYNDGADGGTSKVLSAVPGTGTAIQFDPLKSVDTTGGANGSKKSLKLDFTYGTNKPVSCAGTCPYGQMVGVGTQFVPGSDAGAVIDLTGATSLSFWAKSSVPMIIRTEVATSTVKDFGFHRAQFNVTTTWTKHSVLLIEGLGGLARPVWATTAIPFDLTKAQKLQFQISAEDNIAMTAGVLWLDDIQVEGYNWVPPSACVPCVGAQGAGTGALLSDLEPPAVVGGLGGTQNAVGGAWYAYNDSKGRGLTSTSPATAYSELITGVTLLDPLNPILTVSTGTGTNVTKVAAVTFSLGPTYSEVAGSVIQPFVGIGTRVSDALATSFLNASTSTGISFDYSTAATSTFKFVRLEVKANQSLGANLGVVHHVLLPATGGLWKSATIPWTKLVLQDWADAPPLATNPLNTAALEKFQWAIQDAPKTTGGIAVDNVKLMGMTTFPSLGIANHGAKSIKGMRMSQVAGRVQVDYILPSGVDAVELSLVDLKGSVVSNRNYSGKGVAQFSLETRNLRSGLYSLQVRHAKGNESMPITLLK